MWPKALTQLIELAPHLSRLLPMADRFLQSKGATEEASRKAMDAMAEGLRGDLGQVTASHAGLYRELHDQSDRLTALAAETRTARLAAEAAEASVLSLEARLRRLGFLFNVTFALLAIVIVLLVVMLLHHR